MVVLNFKMSLVHQDVFEVCRQRWVVGCDERHTGRKVELIVLL